MLDDEFPGIDEIGNLYVWGQETDRKLGFINTCSDIMLNGIKASIILLGLL